MKKYITTSKALLCVDDEELTVQTILTGSFTDKGRFWIAFTSPDEVILVIKQAEDRIKIISHVQDYRDQDDKLIYKIGDNYYGYFFDNEDTLRLGSYTLDRNHWPLFFLRREGDAKIAFWITPQNKISELIFVDYDLSGNGLWCFELPEGNFRFFDYKGTELSSGYVHFRNKEYSKFFWRTENGTYQLIIKTECQKFGYRNAFIVTEGDQTALYGFDANKPILLHKTSKE